MVWGLDARVSGLGTGFVSFVPFARGIVPLQDSCVLLFLTCGCVRSSFEVTPIVSTFFRFLCFSGSIVSAFVRRCRFICFCLRFYPFALACLYFFTFEYMYPIFRLLVSHLPQPRLRTCFSVS